MPLAEIIVVEQREWLQLLLKAEWPDLRTQIQAASTERGLIDLLPKSPYSFVVFHLAEDDTCQELARRITQLRDQFPNAALAAVGTAKLSHWEFALREAGLVHIQFDCRHFQDMFKMASRKLEQAPKVEKTFRETVWTRLPWNL
ncbi:MAG: hypothetical protein ACI9G1_001467 [Pirellulaceae bacterium]|jgi:predicted oxidoreductase (fatty acid repression mutant protein)